MGKRTDFGNRPPFTLSVPKCPKCGGFPRGLPVRIEGTAHMYTENEGETFEYNGHTDISDEYKQKTDKEGRSVLICWRDHRWKSVITFKDRTDG